MYSNECPVCPECPACPQQSTLLALAEMFIGIFRDWQTGEVLVRGFMLGFGLKMMAFLFFNNSDDVDVQLANCPKYARLSVFAGMALSTLMLGSSFFLPTGFRAHWFEA
mmetsp:Transcript_13020/g.35935  ORF Transcript_13020/g.35935 Transcript_13020/m.35935 type:complete len:109 (-) Transcript_13020:976-1302(-)|eukprot:CAMPEP_0198124668 /NCGR_PEP_ID=MMETSP1442-20131203/40545_1 /TAXON_ID= /ORGANISM="Craspedostauros australis, Strain CCMP3328" /LENGTH=108 /DNA_ID=CAMNT_0043784123 /DNA_START=169 /DNA_END=495 /DNA_ORIENTATION=+